MLRAAGCGMGDVALAAASAIFRELDNKPMIANVLSTLSGLEFVRGDSRRTAWWWSRSGTRSSAYAGTRRRPRKGDRFDPFRVGLDHLSFGVESVELLQEMKRTLDAAGVRKNGVQDESALNAKALVFYDPDGIALELYFMAG